ncbi:alpha/beta fold hydrolase [Halomicronema hongdechloris]
MVTISDRNPIDSSGVGQHWTWRGQPVYYVQAGPPPGDRPPLLLVHGFGASTDHWRKNLADLQHQFQVWAIDLVGFGRSAKPPWQYSGDLWQAQLHDFITQVIGQPVVLVGNSLGGYASLCVAANHPEAAAGLVLLNSAGPFSDAQVSTAKSSIGGALAKALRSVMLQPLPSWLLFQYVRRRATIRKTLMKVYLDATAVTDDLVEAIYRPACDAGAARVFASVFKAPRGEPVDVLLTRLCPPLLTLWGEGDPWMDTRQRGARFRQYYPQLTEHYLPAGHCPHDERPELVNDLMRDWVLTRVCGQPISGPYPE